MKRILITGASGFIGRSLCRSLIGQKYYVRAVVRSQEKAQQVQQSFASPYLEDVVIHELAADPHGLPALKNVDAVIHLAARVHITKPDTEEEFLKYREMNVAATANLAKAAIDAGVKRFLFLSSIGVNGLATTRNPFCETDIAKPLSAYAMSKWEAEQVLQQIGASTDLKITILRPPIVYGHGVQANFGSLLKLIQSGLPIPLAKVKNLRSLIYVENLVDAIITCLQQAAAENQTYLVSDSEPVSTPNLIREIAAALGKTAHLWPFPLSLMRSIAKLIGKSIIVDRLVESLEIDCTKIKNELGWTPPYTLQEALQRDFGSYKER